VPCTTSTLAIQNSQYHYTTQHITQPPTHPNPLHQHQQSQAAAASTTTTTITTFFFVFFSPQSAVKLGQHVPAVVRSDQVSHVPIMAMFPSIHSCSIETLSILPHCHHGMVLACAARPRTLPSISRRTAHTVLRHVSCWLARWRRLCFTTIVANTKLPSRRAEVPAVARFRFALRCAAEERESIAKPAEPLLLPPSALPPLVCDINSRARRQRDILLKFSSAGTTGQVFGRICPAAFPSLSSLQLILTPSSPNALPYNQNHPRQKTISCPEKNNTQSSPSLRKSQIHFQPYQPYQSASQPASQPARRFGVPTTDLSTSSQVLRSGNSGE
jgi:hypothetical protein